MFGLGTVSLLTDISSESVAAILPLYVTAVAGMGPLAYGFLDGIYQGISAAVRLLGGWWADRTDRPKRVALFGYTLSATARIGLLLSSSFAMITGVVAADRIGKGLRTGPRDALISTAADPVHLGRNFGVHRAMDTAGAMIGPLLAFAVLALLPLGMGGYRSVFVISVTFAFLGVVVLALMVPDLRRSEGGGESSGHGDPRPEPVPTRSLRRGGPVSKGVPPTARLRDLRNPRLTKLLVAAGVLGIATVGDGFLYLALADAPDGEGQVPASYFPLLFVGTNLAYMALAVPLGRLGDRIGRGKVFVAGHLPLMISYLLAATHVGGVAGVIITLLLLGTFYAATDGVLAALASRLVPADVRASGISVAQTVVALARFGSSVGFGLMWQLTGRPPALMIMAVLLLGSVVVAAALLVRIGRETATTP